MIPLEDARARVLAALPAPQPESPVIADSLGLVLAADVRSPSTVPPFDNSAMDGYAVRHEDLVEAAGDALRPHAVEAVAAESAAEPETFDAAIPPPGPRRASRYPMRVSRLTTFIRWLREIP